MYLVSQSQVWPCVSLQAVFHLGLWVALLLSGLCMFPFWLPANSTKSTVASFITPALEGTAVVVQLLMLFVDYYWVHRNILHRLHPHVCFALRFYEALFGLLNPQR